jgi:hypothetical protein
MQALTLIAEAGAVLILSGAAYMMSLKDKLSQDKLEQEDRDLAESEKDKLP